MLGIDPALRRMQLSLASQKARAAAAALQASGPQPGEVADGIVAGIEVSEDGTPAAYTVDLRRGQEVVGTGRLEVAHLADHPAAGEALQDSIQVRGMQAAPRSNPPPRESSASADWQGWPVLQAWVSQCAALPGSRARERWQGSCSDAAAGCRSALRWVISWSWSGPRGGHRCG